MKEETALDKLLSLKNSVSEISFILKMDSLSNKLFQLDYQNRYRSFTDKFSLINFEILLINLKKDGYKIQDLSFFLKEVDELKNVYHSKEKLIAKFLLNMPFHNLQSEFIKKEYGSIICDLNKIIEANPHDNSYELNAKRIFEEKKIQFKLSTNYILANYYKKIFQITDQITKIFYNHLKPEEIYFEKLISDRLFDFLIDKKIIENNIEKEQFYNFINLLPYSGKITIRKIGSSNSKTKSNTFYKIIYKISCVLEERLSLDEINWDIQIIEKMSIDHSKYIRKRNDDFGKNERDFPKILSDILLH